MSAPSLRPAVIGLALAAVFTLACGGSPTSPTDDSGGGIVTGRIVAADGRTPIPQASVEHAFFDFVSVRTDATGAYSLRLPAGLRKLRARRGNFEAAFSIEVPEGQTVTAGPVALQAMGKLAYVSGVYDSIERIVRGQLGYPMDELAASQLSQATTLNQYQMIFLNCGLSGNGAAGPSLLAWVRAGGTLYASDHALAYILAMLPSDNITYDSGSAGTINATVTDAALQAFVGRSVAQIRYDLGAWLSPISLPSRARVLLRAPNANGITVGNRPLAFVIDEGAGHIVYTSFHNEAGVTADQLDVLRYYIYIE